MLLTMTSRLDSIVQLVSAVLIFVLVLALAYFTTRLTAGIQKTRLAQGNIEVVETSKIATNKFIHIVRIGERYYSLAVCKDSVTVIGEIAKDELALKESGTGTTMSFKEILDKAKIRKPKE